MSGEGFERPPGRGGKKYEKVGEMRGRSELIPKPRHNN
jgi:hypothetical protein